MIIVEGKLITELKDQSFKNIAPKSCADYEDYFALDVPKWEKALYKVQTDSYLYIPAMPNKPSGR